MMPQVAFVMLTLAALVAMVLLDKVRTHIHTLQVASSSAALDKGTGSAEVVPLHFLFVTHLLLLPEQRRSLLG